MISINTKKQKLTFINEKLGERVVFPISTAKNGLGEKLGSFKTPRGQHDIVAKIGDGLPIYTVFRGRRATGEIYNQKLDEQYPKRDWILTRILWLRGLEVGKNRLGQVDTMRRFIYIHGTADEHLIGQPVSHGCIRLKNEDIMQLFDLIDVGERVVVAEDI